MPDNEKSVAGSEEEIISQELKLADKLAVQRTVLAADRTILAGVAYRSIVIYRLWIHDIQHPSVRAAKYSDETHAASHTKEYRALHAAGRNHPSVCHDDAVCPVI